MRVLGIAAFALALTACGGSGVTPLTAKQVKHCSVHVYFSAAATHAEESAVDAKLRADSRVVRVTFVSKAQALAQMTKKYPDLTSQVTENPLPDSYIAVPDQLSDGAGIASSMRHLAGVANVTHGSPIADAVAARLGRSGICSQG